MGPWRWRPVTVDSPYGWHEAILEDANHRQILKAEPGSFSGRRDADLIAAAPELLLEAKILLAHLKDVDAIAPYEDDLRKGVAKAISGAEALIARLEGGPSAGG